MARLKPIALTPIELSGDAQWDIASYPADGGYLLPDGIALVTGRHALVGVVRVLNGPGWDRFLLDDCALVATAAGEQPSAGGIDLHRLLDQVITLAGKAPGFRAA